MTVILLCIAVSKVLIAHSATSAIGCAAVTVLLASWGCIAATKRVDAADDYDIDEDVNQRIDEYLNNQRRTLPVPGKGRISTR